MPWTHLPAFNSQSADPGREDSGSKLREPERMAARMILATRRSTLGEVPSEIPGTQVETSMRRSIPVDNLTMLDHPIVRLSTGVIVADAKSEVLQATLDLMVLKNA